MTRHLRLLLALSLILLSSTLVSALNITGTVIDTATKDPLIEASVRLLSASDSSFVKGVSTNINGKFTLSGVKKGRYIAQFTYIGYSTLNVDVDASSGSNMRLGTVGMKEASEILGELEVVAVKTPIKVMEDTVEYNADSYHTQPNAVVEDLLKRLPGVEVDSDGNITAHGKSVTKFLLNGKEFFSDDPQVASKNLPVDMIDKLQVVDRKSDFARLTGVDDGEDETVINLTVKKGRDNGWFGNAQAGYGTDSRYQANFNVNRFWNGNQVTFLGNLNNINQLGFSDGSNGRFRGGRNGGITISRALGLNFNVGNEEIFRVGGDVMFSNTDRNVTSRQDRQYIFTDSTAYAYVRNLSRSRSNNFSSNFRMLWQPDSFNTLEFRPRFSLNHKNGFSADSTLNYSGLMQKVSSDKNFENSSGNAYDISGRIIYSHKFRTGRSFSLSGDYSLSNTRERVNSISDIVRHLTDDDEVLDQYADNHTWSNQVSARVTWNEPLGALTRGNFLVFSYNMRYRWNNADKFTYTLPDDYDGLLPPVGIDPDPDYSRSYRNNYFSQNIRLGFKHTGPALNYEAGIAFVPQMTKSIDHINTERNIDRWVLNFAPYLRLKYKWSKNRSLQANYRGRSSQPSIDQMNPVPDISNPMNITVGNPNLKPSFAHNINLRFQDYNPELQRSIMLNGDFTYTQNSIISQTTYDPQTAGRTTHYLNVNGVWSARLMNMMSMPLRNKAWSISNHLFGNASQSIGFNNETRNTARDYSIFESPGISFRPDNFEFELRPQYRLQLSTNSMQQQNNRTIHSYGGRLDVTYYTPWGLTLQSDVNYTANKGYSAGYNTNEWRWNASISQQFLKNKSLTVAVKAYDLLAQVSNIRRTINANYIQDTWQNTLTRYFMFSISYKFNTFGKGNEPSGRDNWGGGPGGRPGGMGGRPGGMGGGRPRF